MIYPSMAVLYKSFSNMLKLKGFHFSLWLVITAMYVLLENKISKHPQQSPPDG